MSLLESGDGVARRHQDVGMQLPLELSTRKKRLIENLQHALKPYESMLLSLQRLLMWENLTYSSVFIVLIHGVFIYVWSQFHHIIGFLSSFTFFVIWLDVWKEKIWPEVRAYSPSPDSEWGELHPRLLTLYEMSELLADLILMFQDFCDSAKKLRKEQHSKFTTIGVTCCLLLMLISSYIPTVVIFYFMFAGIVFWPCIWHHRLMEKTYTAIEPYMMGLQYTLKQHPGENYNVSDQPTSSALNTPDEDFISEFIPQMNNTTVAVLAKALTEGSELSETDEGILAAKLPSFSRLSNMSHADSFVEDTVSTVRMPTPDDVADSSDDEQIGFVPSRGSSLSEAPNKVLTSEGSQVLNDIIKDVSANAAGSISKIVQGGLAVSLAQLNPQNIAFNQNQLETQQRRSDSSTPSSEFEILDSAMLD